MKNIAVIPARGGSKRIPFKNIKLFLGKPIITYSIEIAKKSGLFDEIIVSTDNEEIRNIALESGANVPFYRSADTSNDKAPLGDVMKEVINWYSQDKIYYDYYCCILATAPLITLSNLRKGLEIMEKSSFDSVRPVVKFEYPIQKALRMDQNSGKMSFFNEEYLLTPSQELEAAYHDAGQFYWMKPEIGLFGSNKGCFEISSLESQDIDEMDDWEIAELKYKKLNIKI